MFSDQSVVCLCVFKSNLARGRIEIFSCDPRGSDAVVSYVRWAGTFARGGRNALVTLQCTPQKCPSRWGMDSIQYVVPCTHTNQPSNKLHLHRFSRFTQLTRVHNTDRQRQTDTQTRRPRATPVAICRIYALRSCDAAQRANEHRSFTSASRTAFTDFCRNRFLWANRFLSDVNSRSRSLYAIAVPSVCRLSSVTLVHAPYSAGWNFRQFFFAIYDSPATLVFWCQ